MGPKKQGFWTSINCSQMKLPNFGSPSSDSTSNIRCHFSHGLLYRDVHVLVSKVVLKLKSAKNAFYKEGWPKLAFFYENFF
jgi:hypothetical protein